MSPLPRCLDRRAHALRRCLRSNGPLLARTLDKMAAVTREQAENKIAELRNEIRRHDHLYYVQGRAEISDQEYDLIYRELRGPGGPVPGAGHAGQPDPARGRSTVRAVPDFRAPRAHAEPGQHLFRGGAARVRAAHLPAGRRERAIDYVAELKIDGLSMALHYEGGQLARGVTRGDGVRGDEVTPNVRAIRTVPLRLHGTDVPEELEVRGEVYFPRSRFEAMNREREAAGEETFANPRNAAAGSMKTLDTAGREEARPRHLPVFGGAPEGSAPARPVADPGAAPRVGPPDQPHLAPLPRPRRSPRLHRRVAGQAATRSNTRSTAWW